MIKINLLSEGKRPAAVRKSRVAAAPGQTIALWMLVAGTLVGVLVAGAWWWVLNGRLEEKKQEVVQAQKQVDALQAVIKEVEDFKNKKKNLTDKIAVINDLKSNQRGPVRVMDYVSRSLPELLWLDRMRMSASSIEIEGRAFNPNAVANFMDNLDKVPEFREPVLKDTSAMGGNVYKFLITFDYSFAPKKTDETGKGGVPLPPGTPGTSGTPGTAGAAVPLLGGGTATAPAATGGPPGAKGAAPLGPASATGSR
jgi:Tfp pilus assembly protein PilN